MGNPLYEALKVILQKAHSLYDIQVVRKTLPLNQVLSHFYTCSVILYKVHYVFQFMCVKCIQFE